MIEYWVGLSTASREIKAPNYKRKKAKFDIDKREDGTAFLFNASKIKFETQHHDWGVVTHVILTKDPKVADHCYGLKLNGTPICRPNYTITFGKYDIRLVCDKKLI